nr:MAG TPA: hypothetical protein [Caudoviricetes sp.]
MSRLFAKTAASAKRGRGCKSLTEKIYKPASVSFV